MKQTLALTPILLLALAATGGCKREQAEAPEARAVHDIAKVEAAQHQQAPVVAFAPETVGFADLDAPGQVVAMPPDVARPRSNEGCRFIARGTPANAPVLVGVDKVALMKRQGMLEVFAADSGSALLKGPLHAKYASGGYALELTQGTAAGSKLWNGALTVRDPEDRIVYFSAGTIDCRG